MATACSKLILFGEHAVVYGQPGIAVPLHGLRMEATVKKAAKDELKTKAAPVQKKLLLLALKIAKAHFDWKEGAEVRLESTIPIGANMGSSAALCVSIIRAMAEEKGKKLSNEEIFRISFEMESVYHGTPSGIDPIVVTYELPVFFIKGTKPEFINVKRGFELLIVDTGKRASTKDAIMAVKGRMEKSKEKYLGIFEEIGKISIKARKLLEYGKTNELGELMNQNHGLLKEMGVSSEEIEKIVKTALDNGAAGAKLSGAGMGGMVIVMPRQGKEKELLSVMSRKFEVIKVKL